MARVALVDPELTVPCPADITAHCGLDALSQAVESYVSIHATAITEALSLRAAAELVASIETAVKRPTDREARTRASLGSLMAGMALGNARLGVIHGIVHPLGVRYGIPHGLACGVFLPTALEYNREAMGEKYAVLTQILGGDPVEVARGLLSRLGVAESFKPFRVDAAAFGAIADESLPSGSLKANPRKVSRDDVIGMLQRLC
jgi:alcohol dehydrogenase class IV